LLQSWATAQDLRKPKLADGTFHVLNLALSWWRSLDPLRRLSPNTANHIRMGQSLRSSLTRLDVKRGRKRLRDPGVQRGCSAWDDEVFCLVPRRRSLAGARTKTERRSHVVDEKLRLDPGRMVKALGLYIGGEQQAKKDERRCNRPWSPRNSEGRVSLEGFVWSGQQ